MKRLLIPLLCLLAMMVSCSESTSKGDIRELDTIPTMVMQIQKCSRLYTTEYHLHKIITHGDTKTLSGSVLSQNFDIDIPIGERKIAIPLNATVKAYIDFSNFSEKNIRRRDGKLEVILPDPRIVITSTKIDHDDIKQYVALLRGNFTDEELSNYERQGRKAIMKDLPKLGIVRNARQSAARTLIPLFAQMGYNEEDVTITFRKRYSVNDLPKLIDNASVEHAERTTE